MDLRARTVSVLTRLHWARGVRAGVAVSVAMMVCHLLGRPMGWAALGGFETILVDNGGPYRSRLKTMGTLMAGGAVACVVASLTVTPTWLACLAAALFCFAATFARVLAQPIASTSVIILVIYFADVGAADHTVAGTLRNALEFVLGGAWAAALSLVLWPLDPFRPARLAVVGCYTRLAEFTAGLYETPPHSEAREAMRLRTHGFQRGMRLNMEEARTALGATAARSASRTVRARNLTVLLETADLLFAETLRWTELIERAEDAASREAMAEALRWLGGAERAVAAGLAHRPSDGGVSFAPEGSYSLQYVRGRAAMATKMRGSPSAFLAHLGADEQDALQNVEIAFEAVRAVWTGLEARGAFLLGERAQAQPESPRWVEVAQANWTRESVMMRHALRIAIVAGVDVLLMRVVHVSHGSWLAMTSIIVLQPYGSGTMRKTAQRVGGTIAGGVLAAALAASIHSQAGIIAVITATSVMTLATFAVEYGWYTFFLTPTFVLMSLPHLRDWRFAGVRMGTTVIGALVALVAMRVLWPEREELHLGRLLGRGAAGGAEYLQAMVRFWRSEAAMRLDARPDMRREAEREVLAPARREAGLRLLDAEETLDRLMLEPGRRSVRGEWRAETLTFITYLRRLLRATTTLAAVGTAEEYTLKRVEALIRRLDAVSTAMTGADGVTVPQAGTATSRPVVAGFGEQQMQRMERQVGVLERATAALLATKAALR